MERIRLLRWFGYAEIKDENRKAEGCWRVLGRPRLSWMDDVKLALGNTEITVENAPKMKNSGETW